ncbi:hypothetical protein [Streptomyces sp. SID4982]|uniref:hypothetical protein n=1 Tax=Streptomyces sp. SID4982 TaxID=2690291 RepID=UPI0013719647|nr:hypothetical protein [Streptomyces sp. SID4982]MYS15043.1 hypothetical protein [Streptomyces sp. SID4982]
MPNPHITVHPPNPTGGRRITADHTTLGTAYSLHDLTVFLQHAGLDGWDGITWHGGGPDTWT